MKQFAIVHLSPLHSAGRIPRPKLSIWAAIAVALALASYVAIPRRVARTPAAEQPVSGDRILITSALSLSATRTPDGVDITWNAAATPVSSARVGVLSVKDGSGSREIPLNQSQLKAGKLLYRPESDRLSVALEVFTGSGDPVRESMIVAVAPQAPQSLIAPAGTEAAEVPAAVQHRESLPQHARRFVAPAQPVRRASQTAALLLSDVPSLPAAGGTFAAPALPAVSIPPPPPNAVLQAARPLRQVKPTVPLNVAALVRTPVSVRIRVRIDAQGQVTHAEALNASNSGVNGYLAQSAVAAARLWSFAPARQGSTSVPSEMVLSFAFGAGQ